ncbi:MAG: hypothetical protein AB3N17_02120 [Tateyamaria sp.]
MTQATSTTAYGHTGPARKLSDADAQFLHAALVDGEHAIARQKDMIELHKRIVAMFTTLNSGLGEQQSKKAEKDREILVAKLDEMGRAVNGMEAAFRIEMAPVLEQMFVNALETRLPKRRSKWPLVIVFLLALASGLGFGAVYSDLIVESVRSFLANMGI